MTQHDRFLGSLDAWLHEEGAQAMPPYIDAVIARTETIRQRPTWMSPGRWLPMDAPIALRAHRIPSVVRYVALAVLILVLAIAVLALSGAGRPRLPAPFGPAANGVIAYDADGVITLVGADGTTRTTLDLGFDVATRPSFSPDGTRVAFFATEASTGLDGLYVAGIDGTGARLITPGLSLAAGESSVPSWSPDGTRVVLAVNQGGLDRLVVADADGSGARVVGAVDAGRSFPTWSTDGAWIAFVSYPISGRPSLDVIHPDGSGERTLVAAAGTDTIMQDLRWAPDASGRLAYAVGDQAQDRIEVVDAASAAVSVVVDRPGVFETGLSWSPDARRIASNQSDLGSIVVDADGRNLRILEAARCAGQVSWSPDGSQLLCLNSVALGEGTYELLLVDADGDAPAQVIDLGGEAAGQAGAVASWQRVAP